MKDEAIQSITLLPGSKEHENFMKASQALCGELEIVAEKFDISFGVLPGLVVHSMMVFTNANISSPEKRVEMYELLGRSMFTMLMENASVLKNADVIRKGGGDEQ